MSLPGLVCELQRDWVRKETVQLAVEIILSACFHTVSRADIRA
jgi:hypothetical protein